MLDNLRLGLSVAGALWGLFVGLLPFALVAMRVLSHFDPKKDKPE